MGNVVQAGLGQSPRPPSRLARRARFARRRHDHQQSLWLGTESHCPSWRRLCGLGESEIVVAGGMESMSNCPYLLKGARTGYRLGNQEMFDSMITDGLWDVYEDYHMDVTGELVGQRKYGISRQEQDQFALESHQKAIRAIKILFLRRANCSGRDPAEKRRSRRHQDRRRISARRYFARSASRAEGPCAFKKDGTVTAGNAPGTNDGAASRDRHQREECCAPRQTTDGAHRRASRQRRPNRNG